MIRWLDCIRDRRPPVIHGDGSTTMDFVFVKDIAKANVAALFAEKCNETFNIGSGEETSLLGLLDLLFKVNGSDLQPAFREENQVNPVKRRLADISKAKRMLGFTPATTLENGIRELSDWYFLKKQNHLST